MVCPRCRSSVGIGGVCATCVPQLRKAWAPPGSSNLGWCSTCGSQLAFNASGLPAVWGTGARWWHGQIETAAVLLAVFFSFWTWLYTYRIDAAKFWAGLILCILGLVTILFFGGFIFFAVWLWAVLDSAVKPEATYRAYRRTG